MGAFTAAYKNELIRIQKRKKNIIAIIINFAICVFMAFIINLINSTRFSINATTMPTSVLGIFSTTLFPFYVFMLGAEAFSSEYGDGAIKIALIRPVTRTKIYLAKVCSIITFLGVNMAVVFIASLLCGTFLRPEAFIKMFLNGLPAYILALLPLTVLALMSVFFSQLTKSGLFSIVMSIFFYGAMLVLERLFDKLSPLFFTTYINWHRMFTGAVLPVSRLLTVALLHISYGIVFISAGNILFEKKNC